MKSVCIEVESRRRELRVGERVFLQGVYLMSAFGMRNTQDVEQWPWWCSHGHTGKDSTVPALPGLLTWAHSLGEQQLSMGRVCLWLLSFQEKHPT